MISAGRLLPGQSDEILEREHLARYQFASSFARDCSVLDVACGMGYAAPMFIEAGARSYVGVDVERSAVGYAIERYGADNKIAFYLEDACELKSIEDSSVELVVSFETIEHLHRPDRFLANVRRVLRSEGTLVISTPNRHRYSPGNKLSSKPWNPYHVREWNVKEFLRLLDSSFRTIQVLGQMQIPCWKAELLYYAARFDWLQTLVSTVHHRKMKKTKHASDGPQLPVNIQAVRPITPWFTPMYSVCVAKPKL